MIYTLLTGGFHLRRRLYDYFKWDYGDIEPHPIALRNRALLLQQIRFTRHKKLRLRPVITNDMIIKKVIDPILSQINNCPHQHISFDENDYADISSDDSVDIDEYK